jgi:hypothetical protein
MTLLKQALAVLGTVVVIAMIVVLVTPKTAHAIVATFVQVVNTPSQPVPTVATDALTSFVASNYCHFGHSTAYSGARDVCGIEPLYTVPAGKTAVIESASGVCVTYSGPGMREFQLQFTSPGGGQLALPNGNNAQLSFPPTNITTASTDTITPSVVSTTAENLKAYASGGSSGTPIIFFGYASANQVPAAFGFCTVAVSGHLF